MEETKKIGQEGRFKKLISDIFIFGIGTVLAKAIQFFLMPMYTSYLTTDEYGVAELTNNLSELLFPIVTLCIYEAMFRFAVDSEVSDDNLVTTVFKLLGGSLLIGAVLSVILKVMFRYEYAFYLFVILYAYSYRMSAAYYVRGRGYSKVFAVSGVINALALGVCNIVFIVAGGMKENGYLLSIGVAYMISALYLLIRGKVYRHIKLSRHLDKKVLSVLLHYSVPLIFHNILYWGISISGRYILLWFTDSATAGIYVAVIKIAAIINMMQQAVTAAFQLNSSAAFSEKGREEYYAKISHLFLGIYIVFGSMIICLSPLLAKLTLKNDFYAGREFLPIIMLAAILNCISALFGTMYSAYKITMRTVPVSMTGAAINVILGVVLVPELKIWGICIASVFCYLSQIALKMRDMEKICKIKLDKKYVFVNIFILTLQVVMMKIFYT